MRSFTRDFNEGDSPQLHRRGLYQTVRWQSTLRPGPRQPDGAWSRDPPRSHETWRITQADLVARLADAFPLVCLARDGDARLIAASGAVRFDGCDPIRHPPGGG